MKIKQAIRTALFSLTLTLLLGCHNQWSGLRPRNSSSTGSLSGQPGDARINPFSCNNGAIGVEPLRRLTRQELENTIKNLIGPSAFGQITPDLGGLYSDQIAKNVGDFSASISDSQMTAYQTLAEGVYAAFVAHPEYLSEIGLDCAKQAVTSSCRDTAIANLGLKAFRRPLSAAETLVFQGQIFPLGANGAESVAWVLHGLILSPSFLLHIERGSGNSPGSEFALTSYEVASRLSYLIADSPPDSELFAAAAADQLKTTAQLKAHVDRLFATGPGGPAAAKIHRFFDYLLQPKSLNAAGFAGDLVGSLDVGAASDEYRRELNEYIDSILFDPKGSFNDLIIGRAAFPRTEAVAQILGARKLAAGEVAPSHTSSERLGLLMRPSVLATDGNETHPIVRGVKLRARFLCENLGVPEGVALAGDVSFSGDQARTLYSTRYRTEKLTGSTSCLRCHANINPMGFAFDNFDSLGRLRQVEKSYAANGAVLGIHRIDTSVQVPQSEQTSAIAASDGVHLIEHLMTQNQLPACFATQMHRFYRLRSETDADGCLLQGVYTDLMIDPEKSLLDAFKMQVLNLATLRRRMQ